MLSTSKRRLTIFENSSGEAMDKPLGLRIAMSANVAIRPPIALTTAEKNPVVACGALFHVNVKDTSQRAQLRLA